MRKLCLCFIILLLSNMITNADNNNLFTVNVESLFLRNETNRNSKILMKLSYGTKLDLIEKSSTVEKIDGITANWYKVKVNNSIGYVFGGYVVLSKYFDEYLMPFSKIDDELKIIKKIVVNSDEYGDPIEKYYMKKEEKFFSRKNDVLEIKLNNGSIISYKNIIPNKNNILGADYSYHGYISQINCVLVCKQYHEGRSFVLINIQSGDSIEMSGLPKPSINFKKVLSVANAGVSRYHPNRIEVVSIKNDRFIRELKLNVDFEPTDQMWLDDDSFIVKNCKLDIENLTLVCNGYKQYVYKNNWMEK